MLAGWKLGGLIDHYGWVAFFAAMAPFSALGMILMLIVCWRTHGRDVKGS
jgi:sugar phosphate permease